MSTTPLNPPPPRERDLPATPRAGDLAATPSEGHPAVTPHESEPATRHKGDLPATPPESDTFITPRERGWAFALLAVAVALRLVGVWEYRFNSDEPQHAHVVWGWTRGLIQYRDFFDNHTPLFHMLWAPLLAAFGESVRSLFWLRLTMLPLYLAALAVTYVIGRRLLSPRAALWGTVLTALLPPFFVKTLEFRTDVPWTLLWLAAYAVATGGAGRSGRLGGAGQTSAVHAGRLGGAGHAGHLGGAGQTSAIQTGRLDGAGRTGRLGGAGRSGRLGGGLGPARLFTTGLLVGAAAAVSLKSSLLLVCMLGSALAAALWPLAGGGGPGEAAAPAPGAAPARQGTRAIARALAGAAAGLAGLLAVPAAVALYFQRHGALDALLAGAVWHNLQVSQHGPAPLKRALILAIGAPLLLVVTRWSLRAGPPAFARQRLFLAATAGSYLIAMQVLWPLITSQTYLPVEALLCLFIAAAATAGRRGRPAGISEPVASAKLAMPAAPAALAASPAVAAVAAAAGDRGGEPASGNDREAPAPSPARDVPTTGRSWSTAGRAFLALALAVELVIDVLHGPLRGDQTAPTTAIVAAALRLTGPGEAVFDDKGDAVFRRRAFFPVLEDITREAMAQGRIADTIPEAILANHACVATLASRRLPPRGKQFLDANFLPVGPVRVCGKWLAPALAGAPARAILFQVQIPGRYAILGGGGGGGGQARGRLDGVELAGPRELAAGVHVFEPRSPPPLALIWARAAERGFSPFPAPAAPARR